MGVGAYAFGAPGQLPGFALRDGVTKSLGYLSGRGWRAGLFAYQPRRLEERGEITREAGGSARIGH
ncbi:hypothetical protein OG840_61200 [Streptomyces sp. NBC_01764]|uniref:hypothetical protein n=1 Tax=Streptomyces sp. NBC_01764 TaxID=2975935 RepID=UPI00225998EE|nr:hypothetical protein [Streptomyces sp. NBC_01764]MCX4411510.1 hypothetical protein [Streptomyces sp. NBC_01764]